MNPVNFSTSNLPKQWQYVKRNLREMGILNQAEVDDIEVKARLVVEGFFQYSINGEFKEQIKAGEYERSDERADIRSFRHLPEDIYDHLRQDKVTHS